MNFTILQSLNTARRLDLLILGFLLGCHTAVSQPSNLPDLTFPVTDGPVLTALETNGILYVGGNFSQIGPFTGGFAPVDPSTGNPVPPLPRVLGTVSCSVPDTQGGVYFGGNFNGLGTLATTNLAHLLGNRTVDTTFAFEANGQVSALVLYGNRLFVGGSFGNLNGQTRSNLAVVDLTSNHVISSTVSVDGPVLALAVSGATLYVGGVFNHVGGSNRTNVASIDLTTGLVTSWNPSPNTVFGLGIGVLVAAEGRIYAGGDFTQLAGATRNQAAAFDAITGALLPWDAHVYVSYTSPAVYSVAVGSNAVYIGGNFTSLGGQLRSHLGAVEKDTGNVLPWNPGVSSDIVRALAVSGNTVYVGGDFPSVGTNGPPRLAALDAISGVPQLWAPSPGGTVLTILPLNGLIYVGGEFESIGGVNRQLLAAVDLSTGLPTSWDAQIMGTRVSGDYVYALAISDDTLFVGGRFYGIAGQTRSSLGAVRLSNAAVLPFKPDLTGAFTPGVLGLVLAGTNLIATGSLPSGSPLVLDTSVGQRENWDFGTDGVISSFATAGNTLYIAGDFTYVSGQPRSRLAAFDATTRQLLPWNPTVDGAVSEILPRDQTVIALGAFRTANGRTRSNVAVFDALSGDLALGPIDLGLDGAIHNLAVSANALYLAGDFTYVNGVSRNYFAAVDLVTGQIRPWNARISADSSRFAYVGLTSVVTPGKVIVGGAFSALEGTPRTGLAAFPVTNSPPLVQIITPTNQTIVPAPALIPLEVQASSPSNSIAHVDVYVRNELLASFTNAPFSTNWLVPSHIGDYLVTAVAYDQTGEFSLSPAARVSVVLPPDYLPPTIAIVFPYNNNTYTFSNITVQTAISSPWSPVEQVQFFLGTNLVGTATDPPYVLTLTNLALGRYSVTARLQDDYGIAVTNGPVTFDITKPPPAVTNTLSNLNLPAGTNWILSALGIGDQPIYYQWQFQNTNIAGATSASLVVANVQATNAGAYSIVVSNAYGVATNVIYTISVFDSCPVIYQQPASQVFLPGNNVSLSTLAYGTAPLLSQWWHNDVAIAGATNTWLTLTNAQLTNAGPYFITISNAFGFTNSTLATLSVGDPYPGQMDWPSLGFATLVTNTFSAPLSVAHAGDGSGRLFIGKQAGRIRIIQGGNLLATPFLDIRSRVRNGGVQGLLSLAFSPGFETNNSFYVYYNRESDASMVVSRFLVTTNRSVADTNSEEVLLVIHEPTATDNGGQIAFGPDGYLYVGSGDGGVYTNAQNPASLLGKLLRIDVEGAVSPYGVPADNPFVTNHLYAPEIWALGLRIPWPFSFDRMVGDLFVSDGGYSYQEIDFQRFDSSGGQNYGWPIRDGPVVYRQPPGFDPSTLIGPATWYDGSLGYSVTGGYVYRGPHEPRMNGIYFFGDFGSGRIWGLKQNGTNWQRDEIARTSYAISTFGEDDDGRLYLADYFRGIIYQLSDNHNVLTPIIIPAGGSFDNAQSLMVSAPTLGATIHYTTDGRDPTEFDSAIASGGVIGVDSSLTLKARAYRTDLLPSAVAAASFNFQVAPPTMLPATGPITNRTSVTITSTTSGAVIHYTLDGSDPSPSSLVYYGPLPINGNTTVRAKADKSGFTDSTITSAYYDLVKVSTPTFTPDQGSITNRTVISMICTTPGATIRYTLDGSQPTADSPVYIAPVAIDGNTTVSAQAFRSDLANSDLQTVFYPLIYVTTPAFSPPEGPVTNGTVVTISCDPADAIIHYTLDDTNPTSSSPIYAGPLTLSGNQTLRAFATKVGYGGSGIQSVTYDLWSPEQTLVTTLAGTGEPGWVDGNAYAAQFNSPQDICVDAAGNVYVADTGNNLIRRIGTDGIVTTVAGNGSPGFQDGPGTNAQFNVPVGICVGTDGNIFVADRQNRRIRRVTPGGVASTFAGTGATGNDDGPPGSARFSYISHIATDKAGNLYVGSAGVIRRIATNGFVTSIPISQTYVTYDPSPAVDPSTNLFIVSSSVYVDKLLPGAGEAIYAGNGVGYADGPRLVAKLPQYPFFNRSIVGDSIGNFYVSDPTRIRKLRADGWVSTLAGSGTGGYQNGLGIVAAFNDPAGLALDGFGTVYVADSGNNRIRKIWVDTYGIGIPDAWQVAHFGLAGIDPNADPDGDGMSNIAEYLAGTDPLNPNSSLKITVIQIQQGKALIDWSGGSTVFEYLQRSSDLGGAGFWQDIFTNPPSAFGEGSYSDLSSTNTFYFYRIRVGEQ